MEGKYGQEGAVPRTKQDDDVTDGPLSQRKVRKLYVTGMVSDSDLRDVIRLLGPADLQKLYYALGLQHQDIEKAEASSNIRNVDLGARKVLEMWRQWHGQHATRKAIIEALEGCMNQDVRQKLQKIWNLKEETSYQFDLEVCKQELITFYTHEMSRVQLLPWCDETRDMDDIYVSLELEQKTRKGTSLLKNEDLVTLKTSNQKPASRVLIKGLAGSGKTTLLTKLAYSWSQQKSDSPLSKFELVFVLSLREVNRGCSLIDTICQQILAVDTKVSKNGLKTFIESHPSEVLILLDGFDEYKAKSESNEKGVGNIENILFFKELRDCCIILSTRPYEDLGRYQSYYISVNLTGFSPANVRLYMTKYFCDKTEMVEGLSKKLQESEMLISLSTIPVILMLLCLLWEDDQSLPNTQSELYQQFTLYLWKKYCVRHRKQVNFDDESEKGEFKKTLTRLGKVALDGLILQEEITTEKLVFSEKDFGELFQLGCQTGLLTRERLRSKLNSLSAVTFLHKSFQEFCAGKFVASTDTGQLNCILEHFQTWDVLKNKIEIIKFSCGLISTAGVIAIIQHAISLYRKQPVQLNTRNEIDIDAILPILNMLYESQFPYDEKLTLSLKSLLSVDNLVVQNKHTRTLPTFHYFVKSAYGLQTLATTKSVEFTSHAYDSLDVIADALTCMPHVQNVTITWLHSQVTFVPNVQSITNLSAKISALSYLTVIKLCGRLDISVLLHHLSISSSCRLKSITLKSVVFKPTKLVLLVSNKIYLEEFFLWCIDMDPTDVASLLDAIHNEIKYLQLKCIHVAEAIRHISRIIPHLQELHLKDSMLKEDHIRVLCEFLPRASNLEMLELSQNTVGMAIVSLAQQLQQCSKLEQLYLDGAHIPNQGIIELADKFVSLPNLKVIRLTGNDIQNTGLGAVFKNIHHLTKLESISMSASVDNQCSSLVRDCLAAIGKAIHDKAEAGAQVIHIDMIGEYSSQNADQIRSINIAANKHLKL